MNAGLAETITGIEVVKSTAQEEQEKGKFARNARSYRDYFVQPGRDTGALSAATAALGGVRRLAFCRASGSSRSGQFSVGGSSPSSA